MMMMMMMMASNKSTEDDLRNKFTGCVPDENVTKELWVMKPIQMDLIGELEYRDVLLTRKFTESNKKKLAGLIKKEEYEQKVRAYHDLGK